MADTLPKPLSDGLVLRRGRAEDAEAIADFNSRWLSDEGPDHPELPLAVWSRDVFSRPHPTFRPELATVVEDANTGRIVSSIMLFPQTWTYAGIPFGVGRPELVATHPDYRNRGLVRLQMETLHGWSAEMGHQMQVITGIPWFYRQFGYEMALEVSGGRRTFSMNIPQLKAGETERFRFRPAVLEDIPFLMRAYEHQSSLERIACQRDEAMWAYEITGRLKGNQVRMEVRIIETIEGTPVGYLGHPDSLFRKLMSVWYTGLVPEASWVDVTPALMRYLLQTGLGYAQEQPGAVCEGLSFIIGVDHPIFKIYPGWFPQFRKPYAWYVRIPDLPRFMQTITPALESRLAASPLAGFTGDVTIGFYRSGLKLAFEQGRITTCEKWQPRPDVYGDLCFPDLTFLSLVCGRRSFTELTEQFPDCYSEKEELSALMSVLFPKQSSNVWGVV